MTNVSAQEYGLDFTVTLTAEDAKFTDEAVAAGVPLIVVTMFRDALRKLVAAEREACAKVCDAYDVAEDVNSSDTAEGIAIAIRARGQMFNGMTEDETNETMSVRGLNEK